MHDARSFSRAVTTLKNLLGRQLTAYIAGVRDPSVVDLWTAGIPDPGSRSDRIWLIPRR
jgi:hypothetical protein